MRNILGTAIRPRRAPVRTLSAVALLLASGLACDKQEFKPVIPTEQDELYWELALNHRAVTLSATAPYDTITLVAVPRTPSGTAIVGLPAPTYVSRDITKLVVTPDGIVHTVDASSEPVWIMARLTAANVTHVDSVRIRILDVTSPPVLSSFSVQPVPPDSAKIAMDASFMPPLVVHAADDGGQPISDVMAAFRSSDPAVALIDEATGAITPRLLGAVTFHASTTMFGVAKADSVRYRVGAPIFTAVPVRLPDAGWSRVPDFMTETIGVGGLVAWLSFGSDSPGFDIEFDDADLPSIQAAVGFSERDRANLTNLCQFLAGDCAGTGNILVTPPTTNSAWRVFTAPGVYDYRCTPCGNTGRVVVVDERQP